MVDPATASGFDIYSVADGSHFGLDGEPWTYGWTSGGELFGVSADGVETCAADTGDCTTAPLPDGLHVGDKVLVRVLGQTYES